MAFTGWRWLDFFLLLGGLAGAYAVIDLALRANRLADDIPADESQSDLQAWKGVTRRTALVTGAVAFFVAIDTASAPIRYLLGAIVNPTPRFRRKPKLAILPLAEGIYENRKAIIDLLYPKTLLC